MCLRLCVFMPPFKRVSLYEQSRVCLYCCNSVFCCKVNVNSPTTPSHPSLQECLSVTTGHCLLLLLTRHHSWGYGHGATGHHVYIHASGPALLPLTNTDTNACMHTILLQCALQQPPCSTQLHTSISVGIDAMTVFTNQEQVSVSSTAV